MRQIPSLLLLSGLHRGEFKAGQYQLTKHKYIKRIVSNTVKKKKKVGFQIFCVVTGFQ